MSLHTKAFVSLEIQIHIDNDSFILLLGILGKFSAGDILIFVPYLSRKIGLTFFAKCLGDSFHKITRPIFWKTNRQISSSCRMMNWLESDCLAHGNLYVCH